jgi:short-subunit dehydrogenase
LLKRIQRHALDNNDGNGQTVLITGASGGIGEELAFVFARHHFNVVAVARNEEKLQALKDELENSYNVEVTTIAKELSNESARK